MNYLQYQPTIDGTQKNIFVVDMRQELNKRYSELMINGISKMVSQGKKVLLMTNNTTFHSGMLCQACGHIPQCKHCDVSIKYHQHPDSKELFGLCHVCKTQYTLPIDCPACGQKGSLKLYGLGMEQLAQFCAKERGITPVLIHKKSANSPKKIERIVEAAKHTSIVIGSSLLTRPPRGISFDLIIVLQADQGLQAPSHAAASKTFQMIHDLIHHHSTPNIILQTFQPEHPSIANAAKNDPQAFETRDHQHKKEFGYPPYGELCALLTKNKIESRLYTHVHKLYQELMYEKEHQGIQDLEIYPTPNLIYKMYDTYRYQILLKGPNVRTFLENVFWKLNISKRGFKADWNPETIG